MKFFILLLIVSILTISSSINAIAIDDYHCKIPTCRDFHYGLSKYPLRRQYVNVCFETVYGLQSIPSKYGTCFHEETGKLNTSCIYALARTIKKCMNGLTDVPEKEAKYFCGYTLMKYCAVHLGLDQFPLNYQF